MTATEPWIRVPRVHTGQAPAPLPPDLCRDVCVTCRYYRRTCDDPARQCAPVCTTSYVRPGPVHVCLITTHVAARLVVRPQRERTTYVGPSGQTYPPPPVMWPFLVVDMCPFCGRPHLHTIRDAGPRWQRRCLLTRRPYHLILRKKATVD